MRHPFSHWTKEVRKVLLLLSSSRGGSSVTTEYLRPHPKIYGLFGEINPTLKRLKLTPPDFDDDVLDESDFADMEVQYGEGAFDDALGEELAKPFEVPPFEDTAIPAIRRSLQFAVELFHQDLRTRLYYAYPKVEFSYDHILKSMFAGVDLKLEAVQSGRRFEPNHWFWIHFIKNLRMFGYPVNPYDFDMPHDLIEEVCPDSMPKEFNGVRIIEEPPFIPIEMMSAVTSEDFDRGVLLIKTPSNAFRLQFFQKAFPNAEFHYLHLVRHPGASINGLIDGWRSDHFQYLYVPGFYYEDLDGCIRQTNHWKFDAPPGWREMIGKPLTEIAKFQWVQTHSAIVSASLGRNYYRIRFEDIVEQDRRPDALMTLSNKLFEDDSLTKLPWINRAIMSTAEPVKDRWLLEREAVIRPLLADSSLKNLAMEFGYDV